MSLSRYELQRQRQMLHRVVQPLPVRLSESLAFTIGPALGATSGKIGAIRVQDIARNLWFNWDLSTRTWDNLPTVTPGPYLYIALWAINAGVDGYLYLKITDDEGIILAHKNVLCPYWDNNINVGVGVETGTKTMPSRPYGITIEVTP